MANITDSIKQFLDDLEIERHVTEATGLAEDTVVKALEKVGDFAHDHEDGLEEWLDKAGTAIDERTEGRYSEAWDKVRDGITTAWAKLAEQRANEAEITELPLAAPDEPSQPEPEE